jgi:hypothetical protein
VGQFHSKLAFGRILTSARFDNNFFRESMPTEICLLGFPQLSPWIAVKSLTTVALHNAPRLLLPPLDSTSLAPSFEPSGRQSDGHQVSVSEAQPSKVQQESQPRHLHQFHPIRRRSGYPPVTLSPTLAPVATVPVIRFTLPPISWPTSRHKRANQGSTPASTLKPAETAYEEANKEAHQKPY